jgi:hypothetical protein
VCKRVKAVYPFGSARTEPGVDAPGKGDTAQAERQKRTFQNWCTKKGVNAVGLALDQDWKRLVTFYEFPKAHWKHLRTSNPIESPFAAVRLRTAAAKRYKKVENATAVIWKTLLIAEGGSTRLNCWPRSQKADISTESGALMTSGPFGLGQAEELRALIAGAGFREITIRPAVKTPRYPSPDEFVRRYVAGSALAGPVAAAGDDARAALLAKVNAGLRPYVDDQGLAFPIESNVGVAQR